MPDKTSSFKIKKEPQKKPKKTHVAKSNAGTSKKQTPISKKIPANTASSSYKSNSEKKDWGKKGMLAGIVADNAKNMAKNSKLGRDVKKVAGAAKTAKTYIGNRIRDPRELEIDRYKVHDRIVNSVRKSAPKTSSKKAAPATRKKVTK